MTKFTRPWLLPFVPLYRAALAVHDQRLKHGWEPVQRLNWPVISIGNLSTGGSGKTPLTIELARLLTEAGVSVDILSRGYGRKSRQAAQVNAEGSWEEFGDEPLLMAQSTGLPVYVASQRYAAGVLAEAAAKANTTNQSHLHLLDDGFQHRQLYREIDILLINRSDWQDSLLPAGNLRETHKAIQRASLIAIPSDEADIESKIRSTGFIGPIWQLRRKMDVNAAVNQYSVKKSEPIAAFCGIAHPEQFFKGIEAAGLQIAARNAFTDHHAYTQSELKKIIDNARKAGAKALLTTEKDLVRLGTQRRLIEAALPLAAVSLRTEIHEAQSAINWLLERVDL
jgi:tetraacyldisaccharide 4'-kinase